MDNINGILEKYFNGVSTIEEEALLKHYFTSDNIAPEHLTFKPLFKAFEIEKNTTFEVKETKNGKKFFLIRWAYAGSGIAAAILLALWLFGSPAFQGDYAIVNGTRINDHELAQQLAQSKINKVGQILGDNLQALESIQIVKGSIAPAKKIGKIKNEIENIKQKLIVE